MSAGRTPDIAAGRAAGLSRGIDALGLGVAPDAAVSRNSIRSRAGSIRFVRMAIIATIVMRRDWSLLIEVSGLGGLMKPRGIPDQGGGGIGLGGLIEAQNGPPCNLRGKVA